MKITPLPAVMLPVPLKPKWVAAPATDGDRDAAGQAAVDGVGGGDGLVAPVLRVTLKMPTPLVSVLEGGKTAVSLALKWTVPV